MKYKNANKPIFPRRSITLQQYHPYSNAIKQYAHQHF